jgi:hypothetical protein
MTEWKWRLTRIFTAIICAALLFEIGFLFWLVMQRT